MRMDGLNYVSGKGGSVGVAAVVSCWSIDINIFLQQKTSANSNTSGGVYNKGAHLLASL